MKTHNLKITLRYYYDIDFGKKTFEIRKNDRDYKVGDELVLDPYDDGYYMPKVSEEFVKRAGLLCKVTYITDYAQQDNYVVLGFKLIGRVVYPF